MFDICLRHIVFEVVCADCNMQALDHFVLLGIITADEAIVLTPEQIVSRYTEVIIAEGASDDIAEQLLQMRNKNIISYTYLVFAFAHRQARRLFVKTSQTNN